MNERTTSDIDKRSRRIPGCGVGSENDSDPQLEVTGNVVSPVIALRTALFL